MHKLYIVGAGPGDPDLLTLKAHKLITSYAETVIYDRLIPEAILTLIPEHVTRIYAGKSCRKHHMTQEEIHEVLLKEASSGKKVVRLKGGDPFIFGRGGEEMLHLIKHQIPFEIVPGITAADGASSQFGIPLTHRGVAHSVRFITGHKQKGQEALLDWSSLVHPETTLVIYMGLTHLEDISKQLIKHGMDKDTPAAVIEWAATPAAKLCKTTISALAKEVSKQGIAPPSIVIIGQVVALS